MRTGPTWRRQRLLIAGERGAVRIAMQNRLRRKPPTDAIMQKVLEIAAEKTGYPPDMLDLDLDLEADLGVDTVKQAEMFAAIRAAYNIPRDENLKLRDFPTLAHVIQFARETSGSIDQAQTAGDAAQGGNRGSCRGQSP